MILLNLTPLAGRPRQGYLLNLASNGVATLWVDGDYDTTMNRDDILESRETIGIACQLRNCWRSLERSRESLPGVRAIVERRERRGARAPLYRKHMESLEADIERTTKEILDLMEGREGRRPGDLS